MIFARLQSGFVFALLLALFCPAIPAHAAQADSPALATAIALFEAKRIPEAREKLAALVASEPKNVRALVYLGLCELRMQRRAAATETLAKAAELAPTDHQILAEYGGASLLYASELGVSFRAIGLARRGRNALEQAVRLAPDNTGYREGLVQFYTRAPGVAGGSFERAYEHIDAISRINPARGTVLRANALCSQERYDEALAACNEFLLTEPDSYLALYTVGRISAETGRDLARGEQCLRRCLQLTPRVEEPSHAGARFRLGLIAEKDNRPADARREYLACLAIEPGYEKATAALARLK